MRKILLAFALSAVTVSAHAAQLIEAVIVRVGDRIVTRSQYLRRLQDGMTELEQTVPADQLAARKEELKRNLLNDLISEMLIKDRADRLGLTVTEAEIKEAIGRLKQQYGITTDAQFAESLRKSGLTQPEMEARLRDTLITNKVFARELRSRQDLTDRELRDRYDREKERYRLPERAHLRAIVIPRPEDAAGAARMQQRVDEIAAEARTATDFAKFASSVPESVTKEKGGDMGEIKRGELLADLDRAVFNSQSGAVLGPIATTSGWHILKVEQRLPSEIPAFESVKETLRRDAGDETFQRDYKAYIDRLRSEAFIQVHEANVPSA
ncbi:MAG TPA: SurA N-terminal domain-containing protein [Thermoanaerobaculia bacterium]|nr:SurA N-terminal domain-containing protein [Thermoanaerobaculia bacterium]